ncbi:hypothetical protein M9Y10_000481 [Tritrichomonas musculus]|uniref:Protein kinase domain-containing protein n=1 Tax=Tritrichomonas musculus TaxID=1915356 RepID=A0ABR2L5A9_9EUKA
MTLRFIKEIPSDMFTGLNEIGTGSFSVIFSATHVKTNTEVALKVSLTRNVEEINKMDQEITINKTLNHPFICRFFSEFDTEHIRVLSMELIDGVSLLHYVNERGGLSIQEAKNIFTQLVISIEYLHDEAHITHRDLKLENIMIDSHGHIRLIDFGFSTTNPIMTPCCGSIPYCAPEVLISHNYTKQADIWSMGIILFALIHGNLPFYNKNMKTLIQLILNSNVVYPPDFDDDLCDLLSKILNKDPTKRITLDEIKLHPFIKNEKFLNIDYKRLFSPSQNSNDSEPESINRLKCYKHDTNIKINMNSVSPIFRKGRTKSLYTPAIYLLKNNLHEKVNLKTDDLDLTIESRKDYSDSLNTLIQSAFDPNSKYNLNKFKIRRCKISMARSCSHMVKNGQLIPQNLNKTFQNGGKQEPPMPQHLCSSQPSIQKMSDGGNEEIPMEELLRLSQPSIPLQKSEESPMEELLRLSQPSIPLQKMSDGGNEESPMEELLRSSQPSIQGEQELGYIGFGESPMEELLRLSQPSLSLPFLGPPKPANSVDNRLKLGDEGEEDSPMKQLLRSSESLSGRAFQSQLSLTNKEDDSPMKKLLRSSESLLSRNFKRLPASSLSKALQQSIIQNSEGDALPTRNLTQQDGKGLCQFKRFQPPLLALNRKPSLQRIKPSDLPNS